MDRRALQVMAPARCLIHINIYVGSDISLHLIII